MQIFLRGLQNTNLVEVADGATVGQLKGIVNGLEGISLEDQVLSFNGKVLDDDLQALNVCGIAALTSVDVSSRLLGGKVHGSLARAGKVKGQTPKVEKKEKKKHRTGRAKRRMQYNRRFVNVVTTPGRRRGPNANVVA